MRDQAAWLETVDFTVATWGRLDILVNNAGYLLPGYIHETGPDEIDRHLDTNAKGLMYGTRAAAARMVKQGFGHIINIASVAGISPDPGLSLYAASKFTVRGFSLSIAPELRPQGVYVTVVCPGPVRTLMYQQLLDHPEAAPIFASGILLTVEDIEKVIFDKVLPATIAGGCPGLPEKSWQPSRPPGGKYRRLVNRK